MKHSKSHGGAGGGSAGLSGLLSNYDAYKKWVRAAHERVQFVKGALAMVDMLADDSDATKHRDLRKTEIERSEANVVKVAEAIVGFINPFEMEQKDKSYCISSGESATSEIERDVTLAEAIMCTFCRSFLVLLYFFFWSLCCRYTDSDYPFWYLLTLLRTHFSLCFLLHSRLSIYSH